MSNITLREVDLDSPDYEQSVALRYRILRQPLNLTFSPDDFAQDRKDIHLAAFRTAYADSTSASQRPSEQLVATLILQPLQCDSGHAQNNKPAAIKMRQVAVTEQCQGQGVGRKLVVWSEEVARARGHGLLTLHARTGAVGFYSRLGYRCVGDEFVEVGIAHQRMEKTLS